MSLNESIVEEDALDWLGRMALIIPSRTLATLRDPAVAGLPKLLSGELCVVSASCPAGRASQRGRAQRGLPIEY